MGKVKTYKLHDDKFSVTITVTDGQAAGVYETDLHELTENVVNGIWDARRSIVVDGVEKNLKLRIDYCTELAGWVEDWTTARNGGCRNCFDCNCPVGHGDVVQVERSFRGSKILVVLCADCSDSVYSN